MTEIDKMLKADSGMTKRLWSIILLFLLLKILICPESNAQSKISIGLQITPGYSSMVPAFPKELSGSSAANGLVYGGSLLGRYYFNTFIGVESGIGLLSYNSSFSGSNYNISFITKDSENESYKRIITGTGISETDVIHAIAVPLHLLFRSYMGKNLMFCVRAGAELYTPLITRMHGTGTFTYQGYYSNYGSNGVLFTNLPAYGFNSNVPVDVKQKISMPLVNVGVDGGAELCYSLGKIYEIFASLDYHMPLTSIGPSPAHQYYLSNEMGSYYSILENGKTKFSDITFSVGILLTLKSIPTY